MGHAVKTTHLPSKVEFSDRYLSPSVPVVIEGLVSSWPALNKWNPEYLANRWGEREVPVVSMHDGDYAQGEIKNMLLGDYLRLIGAIDGSSAAGSHASNIGENSDSKTTHYLAQVSLAKYFPELLDDIDLPSYFKTENTGATVIYAGGSLFSQLHYHPFGSATLSVISGKKRVRLFAPNQGRNLYPHFWMSNKAHLSKTHHKEPSPTEFPNFSRAEYIEVTVLPGEMLFIPIYWWHSIENIGVSISVTSFWSRNWKSRFLPPPGPRGPYLYEPVRKFIGLGRAAITKVARVAGPGHTR